VSRNVRRRCLPIFFSTIPPSRWIEKRELLLVVTVLFGPAERFDALDENLTARRVRVAEDLHHFCDELRQRHGLRLIGPDHLRLHVRRSKFEDLDGRFPKLKAERLQPGVEKSLAGAINRKIVARNEGEA
jgi:hypothetical protein